MERNCRRGEGRKSERRGKERERGGACVDYGSRSCVCVCELVFAWLAV